MAWRSYEFESRIVHLGSTCVLITRIKQKAGRYRITNNNSPHIGRLVLTGARLFRKEKVRVRLSCRPLKISKYKRVCYKVAPDSICRYNGLFMGITGFICAYKLTDKLGGFEPLYQSANLCRRSYIFNN